MYFTAIFIQALLAGAALALPSSGERYAERVERRRGLPKQTTNITQIKYSSNWAGAVYSSPAGTWKSVTATFIVPIPKEPLGGTGFAAASAWVGIDGDTCGTAILQTGVDFSVNSHGSVSYEAWYEWYPDYAHDFSGLSIKAGDSITVTVTTTSTTSGTAVVINNTSGKSVSTSLSSTFPLCEKDAEWIVEDFQEGSSLVPFANFGTVTFTGASAKTASTSSGPGTATLIDIEQNSKVLTSVSTTSSSVTVSHV